MQKSILLPENQFLSLQRQLQHLKSLTGADKVEDLSLKNAGTGSSKPLPLVNNYTDGYIRQRIDSELAKYLELAKKPLPPLPVSLHRANPDKISTLNGFREEVEAEVGEELTGKRRKKTGVKRSRKKTNRISPRVAAFLGRRPSFLSKTPSRKGGFVYPPVPSPSTSPFPSIHTPSRETPTDQFPFNLPSGSRQLWKQF